MKEIICWVDWGILGTWIGAIGAVFFAYKQSVINKRQFVLSRSQLYIDSSIQLLEVINDVMNKVNKSTLDQGGDVLEFLSERINKIYFSSQLYLSDEITKFIEPIRSTILLMQYDYDNYTYGMSVINELKSDPEKIIYWRKEVFMCDDIAYYSYNKEGLKYTVDNLDSINSYCLQQINAILDRKSGLLGNTLESNYSARKISQKYKKWMVS